MYESLSIKGLPFSNNYYFAMSVLVAILLCVSVLADNRIGLWCQPCASDETRKCAKLHGAVFNQFQFNFKGNCGLNDTNSVIYDFTCESSSCPSGCLISQIGSIHQKPQYCSTSAKGKTLLSILNKYAKQNGEANVDWCSCSSAPVKATTAKKSLQVRLRNVIVAFRELIEPAIYYRYTCDASCKSGCNIVIKGYSRTLFDGCTNKIQDYVSTAQKMIYMITWEDVKLMRPNYCGCIKSLAETATTGIIPLDSTTSENSP